MSRPPIRLLIIDDDEDVLQVFGDAARAHGFAVTLASSIDAACAQLTAGPGVDVVMCDYSMPDGGADTWMRACLRDFPALADRTIVVTGWAPPAGGLLIAGIRAEHCLYKPFSMADVRRLAHQMVGSD